MLALLLILVFTVGCAGGGTNTSLASVSGVVTDENGKPISNVRVAISGRVTYTSDTGTWEFEGLSPGSYTVYARQDGYVDNEIYVFLASGHTTIDIKLKESVTEMAARIIFSSVRSGVSNLFTMDAKGEYVAPLFDPFSDHYDPAWSPCGTMIAYSVLSPGFDNLTNIYVYDLQTKQSWQIAWHGNSYNRYPSWSPDSTKLAFSSDRDGESDIYVVDVYNPDEPQRVTNSFASDWYPRWSPDGTQIAFISTRGGNNDIYVMAVDGSNVRRLTTDQASDAYPTWSPDGTQIAFISSRYIRNEVYVMNCDGSNQKRLTNVGANAYYPAWSPDGEQILFVSALEGVNAIYFTDLKYQSKGRLTDLSYPATSPAWSPIVEVGTF
jgi:Tol biopolymer transport system component